MAHLSAPSSSISRGDVLNVRRRALMKDHRGQVTIQKWPRERGKQKTPLQQAWVDRFSCLARELKSPFPWMLDEANNWAKSQDPAYGGPRQSTGWYYRDILERAAAGKFVTFRGEVSVRTPTCGLVRTANESWTPAQFKAVTLDDAIWDNNGFWNQTLNPTRMTMRAPGLYYVTATMVLKSNNAGNMSAELKVNGGDPFAASKVDKNNDFTFVNASGIYYFHAGDYVECWLFNSANTANYRCVQFAAVAITPEALVP